MRVLIVGEGNSELAGALPALVKRLVSTPVDCELDRVGRNDIHAHHGKGRGYFKKAVRWLLEAEKEGYDAVVLVIDEDGNRDRVREIRDAQEYASTAIPRALGLAIRTFDAWILADETALTQVLGYQVQQQPAPETIRDPKSVCASLLEDAEPTVGANEMYAAVARAAQIETLESRCPKGFAPFAQRVRAL